MFEVGAVYRYSYLWARQNSGGEQSGRKDRPACLLLKNPRLPDLLFLFPISSLPPDRGETAFAIPERECRNAGLRSPAWLYLDEFNIASASDPLDFASLRPAGLFSGGFVNESRKIALELIAGRKAKLVKRT